MDFLFSQKETLPVTTGKPVTSQIPRRSTNQPKNKTVRIVTPPPSPTPSTNTTRKKQTSINSRDKLIGKRNQIFLRYNGILRNTAKTFISGIKNNIHDNIHFLENIQTTIQNGVTECDDLFKEMHENLPSSNKDTACYSNKKTNDAINNILQQLKQVVHLIDMEEQNLAN